MSLPDPFGTRAAPRGEEVEESYFASMTDIMVGLLFIFIIMLMSFALMLKDQESQTRQSRQDVQETVASVRDEIDALQDLEGERARMLRDIGARLDRNGVRVNLREGSGVIELPEAVLFDKSEASLDPEGVAAIGHLAEALDTVLPCYARVPPGVDGDAECPTRDRSALRLAGVFIEGHTDRDGSDALNWDLSTARAKNTFRSLARQAQLAHRLRNDDGQYLFSIAGYADKRPRVPAAQSRADQRKNRRIELRFVMDRSYKKALRRVESRLNTVLEAN